jgi:hypothetical protein
LSVISLVTIITPPESDETLQKFYMRCRPPAGWKKLLLKYPLLPGHDLSLRSQVLDCLIGIIACFGLAMATNAIFVLNWWIFALGGCCALVFGGLLIGRSFKTRVSEFPHKLKMN